MTYRRRVLGAIVASKAARLLAVVSFAVVLLAVVLPAVGGAVWEQLAGGFSAGAAIRGPIGVANAQGGLLDCPDNLLVNAGFEHGFSGRSRAVEVVADGWHPWYAKLPGVEGLNYPPDYTPRNRDLDGGNKVLDGLWSQEQATHGATHTAGLWQRVSIPPGSIVRAFISAYAWASDGGNERSSEPPGTYYMALGIDPRAGSDPESSDIVWTQGITVTDLWVPLTLELPVHTSNVTVFTRGQPMRILAHNVSRWDGACLRVVGTVDEPTATPTQRRWPTRTPGPDDPTPTITPSATSDPATQAALDVGLALDMQATQQAAAGVQETEESARLGWADELATPTPYAPGAASGDNPPRVKSGRSIAEWSGLLFLALGAMVGGAVLGLSRRKGPRAEQVVSSEPNDEEADRDVSGAKTPEAPEGEQSP